MRDWDEEQMNALLRQAPEVLRWRASYESAPTVESLGELVVALFARSQTG